MFVSARKKYMPCAQIGLKWNNSRNREELDTQKSYLIFQFVCNLSTFAPIGQNTIKADQVNFFFEYLAEYCLHGIIYVTVWIDSLCIWKMTTKNECWKLKAVASGPYKPP